MNDNVTVKLVRTSFFKRYPCHVCGGHTEKVGILAEVQSGPYEGVRVCEQCLEQRDFDAKFQDHAARLERRAQLLRELLGRLDAPTSQQYEAAKAEWEAGLADEAFNRR